MKKILPNNRAKSKYLNSQVAYMGKKEEIRVFGGYLVDMDLSTE